MKNCREWLEKWLETNYEEIERKRLSREAEEKKREQEEEIVIVSKTVIIEPLIEPVKKSLVKFVFLFLIKEKSKCCKCCKEKKNFCNILYDDAV